MTQQAALWNGPSGQAWVDSRELLDRLLQPFEDLLVDGLSGSRALDVGCGTGATTFAIARRLGANGHATGADISETMLEAARARAGNAPVSFITADAQTYPFEPNTFDVIISRFGVMFFDDSVAAFTNLRRAARSGAQLRFIAWRSPADNPFMTTAERAVAHLLPEMPPRQPDEPGQFRFADKGRVQQILTESGWSNIDVRPVDVTCTMPSSALASYISRLGPVGRVLRDLDESERPRVIETALAAFEPFVHGEEIRFTGASWVVDARSTPK
jgi:ubiquinone/menaquinone biosynthesis C-methylase UbiE